MGTYANRWSLRLGGIVSLDASPSKYTHSHAPILEAMAAVDLNQPMEKIKKYFVSKFHQNDAAFVLKNLEEGSNQQLNQHAINRELLERRKWKVNVDILRKNEHHIHDWNDAWHAEPCDVPCLFIGGSKSSRLTNQEYLTNLIHFKKKELHYVDTGHFVLSDGKGCAKILVDWLAKL